ncbi:hypothetical protein PHMEG_00030849 [Phytophthora megakarya]|uniref:Uncharacterized protein n=1 Tax=Phytophthora megakarya TaxID=4795 RepID=A0A225UZ64_9STRA|nr:hypothetical protein PHMEG_00030849 [Phytophthora megakarya]
MELRPVANSTRVMDTDATIASTITISTVIMTRAARTTHKDYDYKGYISYGYKSYGKDYDNYGKDYYGNAYYNNNNETIATVGPTTTGVNLRWVIDPALAFQILKASGDKGDLIESKLSVPAWRPVISLESVNGEQWRRMKTQFTKLTQVLQPISELTNLFETRGRELLAFETVIDALKVNELSVACFYEWVFERTFDSQKFAEVCHSTWEWRKQIALKGFADDGVKQRTVEWCVEEIRCTPRFD